VDAHLKAIPSLGALPAWRLARSDAQDFGRHAHWALDSQLLVLGTADQICTDLLKTLDVAAGQRDANAVNRRLIGRCFPRVFVVCSHYVNSLSVDLLEPRGMSNSGEPKPQSHTNT